MTEQRGYGRCLVVVAVLTLALGGLAYRLVTLHFGFDSRARDHAEHARQFKEKLEVGRGRIQDGSPSGNILALSTPVKDVFVDPAFIVKSNCVNRVSRGLAGPLGLDVGLVTQKLSRADRHFEYVARFVPEEQAAAVAALKLPGVHFEDVTARSYPHGTFLCHVLGFANLEGLGGAGIEAGMDRFLRGAAGLREGSMDGRRQEEPALRVQDIPAQEGCNVVLTIDQNVQYIVEKALDAALERNHTERGWAIVQRVRTGEILAMVSRPAYDPNDFRHATDAQLLNRTIACVYEPGSTMKVTIIASALDEGIVQADTVFDCENGHWLYGKRVLRDYHPSGQLTVADIVQRSSNIGAAKIALRMGNERVDQALRRFHIGTPLGIDLPGEEAGILHPVREWSEVSATRMAIGQGVSVTALQMLGAVSTIANDGLVMKPFVVKRVVRHDGTVLFEQQSRSLGRAIQPETAALMRRLLTRVTQEGGTGTKAAVPGYTVAGKTGTAQKPVAGHYSENDYMASFVGFLPAEQPDIAMIVVVDTPQPLHTGGQVAAPVFAEIAEQAVRYLDTAATAYALNRF